MRVRTYFAAPPDILRDKEKVKNTRTEIWKEGSPASLADKATTQRLVSRESCFSIRQNFGFVSFRIRQEKEREREGELAHTTNQKKEGILKKMRFSVLV